MRQAMVEGRKVHEPPGTENGTARINEKRLFFVHVRARRLQICTECMRKRRSLSKSMYAMVPYVLWSITSSKTLTHMHRSALVFSRQMRIANDGSANSYCKLSESPILTAKLKVDIKLIC